MWPQNSPEFTPKHRHSLITIRCVQLPVVRLPDVLLQIPPIIPARTADRTRLDHAGHQCLHRVRSSRSLLIHCISPATICRQTSSPIPISRRVASPAPRGYQRRQLPLPARPRGQRHDRQRRQAFAYVVRSVVAAQECFGWVALATPPKGIVPLDGKSGGRSSRWPARTDGHPARWVG